MEGNRGFEAALATPPTYNGQQTLGYMKIVALLSGGKDSCYNLVHCVANGHVLVAAASLGPEPGKGMELSLPKSPALFRLLVVYQKSLTPTCIKLWAKMPLIMLLRH